jgi:sec-independent protein translocase protein TatC
VLRRARNPEGRMPLRAHLVELRNRFFVAGAAVIVCAIAGWFVFDWLIEEIVTPLEYAADVNDQEVDLRFKSPTEAFDWRIKLSLWLGVIGASPVWIYQIWAFITPGLTKKERWYSIGFLGASVPLFLAGMGLAWLVMPNALVFLTSLNPDQVGSIFDFSLYLQFVTRIMLGFGIAFLLPVVMVALNFTGLATARGMLKGWRVAIVLSFVFAAIASPTPDIIVMFALAVPIVALYWAAIGIATVNDWRRGRRDGTAELASLSDDEASTID